MPFFDLSLEELEVYKPTRQEPQDFDKFWQETIADVRSFELNPSYKLVDYGLQNLNAYDVTFNGYGGQPIKGWFLMPKEMSEPLPCVIEYIGYGGGRGFPVDWLTWSAIGYAHFVMDTRGQGSSWLNGDTPDFEPDGSSPQHPGFLTRGILDPNTYYYRRLISDAVRAVETAINHPLIDNERIAITGRSQGGGLSLIVSALVDGLSAVMPDVPFLCHYKRASEITEELPYSEIARFCEIHRDKIDRVFQTLSYFDGINFAYRSKVKALYSVALMDEVCPPSTVFAAYNYHAGEKQIKIYTYNHHEGGQSYQTLEQIKFLSHLWE